MRSEPIVSRTAVAAVIAAVVAILKGFGVEIPAAVADAVVNVAVDVAPIVALAWAAWTARKRVTPLAAPRDAEGLPLVSATDAPAHRADVEPDFAPAPVEESAAPAHRADVEVVDIV